MKLASVLLILLFGSHASAQVAESDCDERSATLVDTDCGGGGGGGHTSPGGIAGGGVGGVVGAGVGNAVGKATGIPGAPGSGAVIGHMVGNVVGNELGHHGTEVMEDFQETTGDTAIPQGTDK